MLDHITTVWRQRFKSHRLKYKYFYSIVGGCLLVLLGVWIGSRQFMNDGGYITNLYTEVIGIAITVFVVDLLAKRREESQYKKRLIRDFCSKANDIAIRAAEELKANGWMDDGSLRGGNFWGANLQSAIIAFHGWENRRADIQNASLRRANLQKVGLYHANLQNVDFTNANLSEANLFDSNLENAKLMEANLYNADLRNAKLHNANLLGANLEKAKLKDQYGEVVFTEGTILPDGSKWIAGCDIQRFIDPDAPNFWRSETSDDVWYRGKHKDVSLSEEAKIITP